MWVLVGVALVLGGMAALRPIIDHVSTNTRLAVAQQSLVAYRFAVLSYCTEFGNLPDDVFQSLPEPLVKTKKERKSSVSGEGKELRGKKKSQNLGELLVAEKKIDRIAFPFGQKYVLPGKNDPFQVEEPQIWAVSLPDMAEHFDHSKLFTSARSGKVAVLVVPFLTAREAEEVQKMVSAFSKKTDKGLVFVGDCFFTRSTIEGRFNGWLYLSDL